MDDEVRIDDSRVGRALEDVLWVLRRLEPLLSGLVVEARDGRRQVETLTEAIGELRGRLSSAEEELEALRERQSAVGETVGRAGEAIARVDGRIGEISARLPSPWGIGVLVIALFGLAFVLMRFGAVHPGSGL